LKSILTPRELGEAIGVSESSVKRWVDQGDIEATKTAGGHRRINVQEAARYLREHSIPLLRPDRLGLSDLAAYAGAAPLADDSAGRLFDFLKRGAEAEARGLLVSEYLAGKSLAEIADGPLRCALERLWEIWTREPAGIFCEHRGSQIAMQALLSLRTLVRVPAAAPVAVGGAPAGDCYLLPSMAAAVVLEGAGMRAVNLGAETPIESLALGVEDQDARLAWLSVSVAADPDQLRAEILGLLAALERRGTPLVVGGSQARRLKLPKIDLLYVGGSMVELEALVQGMRLAPSTSAPPA
jgi:excisionase family DNA binding protein